MKNYYKVLEVSETATDNDIRRAYFALVKSCHPDIFPGNAEKRKRFEELTKAFHFLQNPLNRMGLDSELHAARMKQSKQVPAAPAKEPPARTVSLAEVNSLYANQINEYETLIKGLLKEAEGGTLTITKEKELEISKKLRNNKAKRAKLNR